MTDVLVSTLRSYVEAMGGELELVACFPGQPEVRLHLDELTGESAEPGWADQAVAGISRDSVPMLVWNVRLPMVIPADVALGHARGAWLYARPQRHRPIAERVAGPPAA